MEFAEHHRWKQEGDISMVGDGNGRLLGRVVDGPRVMTNDDDGRASA